MHIVIAHHLPRQSPNSGLSLSQHPQFYSSASCHVVWDFQLIAVTLSAVQPSIAELTSQPPAT